MGLFSKKGPSGFSSTSTAEEVTQGIDATGLTVIVTGASSGIGTETTRVLVLRGAYVVMAVRNKDAGINVKEAILKEIPDAKIDVTGLDLSSMASVRKFAEEYNSKGLPLNILINNAGVMVDKFKLSQDNIELDFATNHLGHFLLTNLLLENMKHTSRKSSIEGRIVNVSSLGHRYTYREGIRFEIINDKSRYKSYKNYVAYAESKLANILHANELTRRLKVKGFSANSLHPGTIRTNIMRNDISVKCKLHLLKTIQQGAATTCFLALNPQVKGVSGEYYVDCNIAKPSSQANDADLAKRLWDFSFSLTNLK
ncbi:short-chain dehydrogenase TIC 32, chloroplastic isoform X2 [Rosa chinensis]|uniref:short-chain dehydrogenase TIC 32, chloroplastic isoform X2 n=1 Tax=Rosa chinensis TaxID=74649 RepID=UPI000D08A297|nr:short-chain dehydrogenase TIC 32, chloroplastic isoform X2 [Rosa chinensis]